MAKPLRALVIDDSEDDVLLLTRELKLLGYNPEIERVDTAEAMAAALEDAPWDVILCDFAIPRFGALPALELYRQKGLDIPFLIVSGAVGEEVAVEAMRAGAHDYVGKSHLARLGPAIEREVREAGVRNERRQAEEALLASRARLQDLVENMPLGVYRVTPGGRIIFGNTALARMLGYESVAELVGLDIPGDLYVDPGARLEWSRRIEQQGYLLNEEVALRKKDGSQIVVLDSARVVRDGPEETICYEGTLAEITARRRAEDALRESEERYRELFENAHDVVYTHDLHGTITSMNRAGETLLGYSRAELVGMDILDLVVPDEREIVRWTMEIILGGSGSTIIEISVIAKGGRRLQLEVSERLQFSAGRPVGLQGVARDITERKRTQALLVRRTQELARSNEELQQFAYIVSHDLQEPLRMISSYVELLGKRYAGKLDGRADLFIHYALDGAARCRQLVQGILAYSRVSTRASALVPTDSAEALRSALAGLRRAIDEAGAAITHDPLPTVLADPMQLLQVFQNLVSNAIKFRGAEPPRVHISVQQDADEYVFAVRDNGIGIEPEDLGRVFNMFERLDQRRSGSGIGLAISKRVVERHGGRIWVESKPGEGSVFSFAIPATEQHVGGGK